MYAKWVLGQNGQVDPQSIVAALNTQLVGWRFVHTVIETHEEPLALPRIAFSYMSVHTPVRLSRIAGQRDIKFDGPIITIPVEPVIFSRQPHYSQVEIDGDHVAIACAYLYHERPRRVDWRYHAITRTRRLDS